MMYLHEMGIEDGDVMYLYNLNVCNCATIQHSVRKLQAIKFADETPLQDPSLSVISLKQAILVN